MLSERQENIFAQLQQAFKQNETITAFTESKYPDLTLQEAYEIQAALKELHEKEGDPLVGYKLGLTSAAKQDVIGIGSPIYGRLFRSYVLSEGEDFNATASIQPRIEPEIAFRLEKPLCGPHITGVVVLEAASSAFPAVEILNSRYTDYHFKVQDSVADNVSSYQIYLGSFVADPKTLDLRTGGVIVEKNGQVIRSGAMGAILGNPANAVAGFVNLLAEQGRGGVEADQFILTGSITNHVPVDPGDQIRITYQQLGSISFRCK